MKPITAFTPYNLSSTKFYEWCAKAAQSKRTASVIEHFMSRDPASHQWNSCGLVIPIDGDSPVHSLDGLAFLLQMEFNDRILPAAVRDEKLTARINAIQEKEGREVTKMEYAQSRDQVESELLPQAFIRRSYVSILVYKERVFICTTSAKKCETIISWLQRLMEVRNIGCVFWNVFVEKEIGPTMKNGVLTGEFDDVGYLVAGNAAVFKGADKRTMRIKDRSLSHKDVQQALIEGAYGVTELRMQQVTDDGEAILDFTLTDKLIFKAIKLIETTETRSAADAHATMFIFSRQLSALYADVIAALGGESPGVNTHTEEEEEL